MKQYSIESSFISLSYYIVSIENGISFPQIKCSKKVDPFKDVADQHHDL